MHFSAVCVCFLPPCNHSSESDLCRAKAKVISDVISFEKRIPTLCVSILCCSAFSSLFIFTKKAISRASEDSKAGHRSSSSRSGPPTIILIYAKHLGSMWRKMRKKASEYFHDFFLFSKICDFLLSGLFHKNTKIWFSKKGLI